MLIFYFITYANFAKEVMMNAMRFAYSCRITLKITENEFQ